MPSNKDSRPMPDRFVTLADLGAGGVQAELVHTTLCRAST
jgi:hypothetical protein